MLMMSNSQGNANTSWIPNFCVNFHVIGEHSNIKKFQYFNVTNQIFIGNGASLSIHSVGFSFFVSPYD